MTEDDTLAAPPPEPPGALNDDGDDLIDQDPDPTDPPPPMPDDPADTPLWQPAPAADPCGARHPTLGHCCRLPRGHEGTPHASHGSFWLEEAPAFDGVAASQGEVIAALDRLTGAIEHVGKSFDHYIEQMFHRVRT